MTVEIILTESDPFVIGVISDSHVPDRVNGLHPALLDELRNRRVSLILHGGDVSIPSVITSLESVAPVRAVTGNRDILLKGSYPVSQTFKVHQTVISLTHGHLNPVTYWYDKFKYITAGYDFERYRKRLDGVFSDSDVIIFGHTHHAELVRMDGRLYFNPGSVSHGDYLDHEPKFGILRVHKDGRIDAQNLPLKGAQITARAWEKTGK
jgi:putative phosphoesterase